MRIVVSDYSGHAFPVQLSRSLAARGHDVLHLSSASFQTPKGKLAAGASDPPSFRSEGVRTSQPFAKQSFFKRRQQEIEIGRKIAERIVEFQPDIVLSGNVPLDTQWQIQRAVRKLGVPFLFWIQDLYGEAITRILGKKLGIAGKLVGRWYSRMEAIIVRRADHNIVIAPDFVPIVTALAGIPESRISVIENWAPLEDIAVQPRDNAWATANLPEADFRMIYSGTLGFKHNPELLVRLAREIKGEVVVFSEGPAAESLVTAAKEEGLTNLRVAPWLPFEEVPLAQAGADALIVILEPDAGIFSVPSKVLTYMCVGRPILGAIPLENLAAKRIADIGAGLVVAPTDGDAFIAAARALAEDAEGRRKMGQAARDYAERAFDIDAITSRFEQMFVNLRNTGPASAGN